MASLIMAPLVGLLYLFGLNETQITDFIHEVFFSDDFFSNLFDFIAKLN